MQSRRAGGGIPHGMAMAAIVSISLLATACAAGSVATKTGPDPAAGRPAAKVDLEDEAIVRHLADRLASAGVAPDTLTERNVLGLVQGLVAGGSTIPLGDEKVGELKSLVQPLLDVDACLGAVAISPRLSRDARAGSVLEPAIVSTLYFDRESPAPWICLYEQARAKPRVAQAVRSALDPEQVDAAASRARHLADAALIHRYLTACVSEVGASGHEVHQDEPFNCKLRAADGTHLEGRQAAAALESWIEDHQGENRS